MKRLEENYTAAHKTAIANNKKAIAKLESLTDEALEGIDESAKKLKRQAYAREVLRTEELANKIAAEIANAGKTAAQIIQNEMTNIYSLNYDFTTYSINKQAGLDLDWTVYDRNQIAVIVQEQQAPFENLGARQVYDRKQKQYITERAYGKLGEDKEIVKRLQDQFIQGILNGESQEKLMKRIRNVTKSSLMQARRIAQTERNRVQSQARDIGIKEAVEMGVNTQKQWVARLINTRGLHVLTHLEVVDSGKDFSNGLEYPGDPKGSAANVVNCFCYIKPMVESVSPSLAKHRKWAQEKSFERYREEKEAGRVKGRSKAIGDE